MNNNTKIKVSSSTQVELGYTGLEARSIVGQEDISEDYLAKTLQNLDIRQKKGIRPPLVGQASSSSNDSVSLVVEAKRNTDNFDYNNPLFQATGYVGLSCNQDEGLNDVKNCFTGIQTASYLANRVDYVNQRLPEGSSDLQPLDNIQDVARIRSSSSASSVTSTRPLEWDNGADLGYIQVDLINRRIPDLGISTVERIALQCSSNLLTRADPEGRTGPCGQPQTIYKSVIQSSLKSKNKIGLPNAESTPFTTCSDASPETIDAEGLSPIMCELHNSENSSASSNSNYNQKFNSDKNCEAQAVFTLTNQDKSRSKIPIFPEIMDRPDFTPLKQSSDGDSNKEINFECQSIKKSKETAKKDGSLPLSNSIDEKNSHVSTINIKTQKDQMENINNVSLQKKLSSSLEDISSAVTQLKCQIHAESLPRSQSQTSLEIQRSDFKSVQSNHMNTHPKYSMALHSLINYNKSASSSSIATVVNRKGDSPKHVFAQTSCHKESIGVQVDGNDPSSFNAMFPAGVQIVETPHLPKEVLSQIPKKSNYFNITQSAEEISQGCFKKSENITVKNDEQFSHFHDGILCKGAHKRLLTADQRKKSLECGKAIMLSLNNSNLEFSSNFVKNNQSRNNDCNLNLNRSTTMVDSVESSAKSGGCGTDKQYSVTVEDRVNSFEYLPGHVYENAERHQGNSRGTSSISIDNQTSNNETPEGQNQLWESSVSATSTFERDVQKGVDVLSDFVKGSCANDLSLKKKLIRRVVERLISKNYSDDNKIVDLATSAPWVPSRLQNPVERNGRETRRSVNISKVPCEFSSHSEKSGNTNTSSECFIPRPAANNGNLPSSLQENRCSQGQADHSSTTDISVEKLARHFRRAPQLIQNEAKLASKRTVSNDKVGPSSFRSSNWKEPVTKTEKLLEEKRKIQDELSSNQSDQSLQTKYLNMERDNHLFWIRSEIQHLNNLKELLEKQEELKKGIKNLKFKQNKISEKDVLKDRNRVPGVKEVVEPLRKKSSLKKSSKYPSRLNSWLHEATNPAANSEVAPCADSSELDMEDWNSHKYESMKPYTRRKNEPDTPKTVKRKPSEQWRDNVIYDEPPFHSQSRKVGKENKFFHPSLEHQSVIDNYRDEAAFTTNKGICKKNAQTETVGVQTSSSVQPSWFKLRQEEQSQKCHCDGQDVCKSYTDKNVVKDVKDDDKNKAPVGYYILLEPTSKEKVIQTLQQSKPLEEVRISVPMSEPKQRHRKRLRAGGSTNRNKNSELTSENTEHNRLKTVPSETPDVDSSESGNTGTDVAPNDKKNIFKGGAGELQYFLLRNRPSYVSRAEDRRQCIAQMQYLRELREQSKQRLLSLTETPYQPAQQPAKIPRVFSQRTMRKQTEKKYRQLSEVKEKQQDTKKKEGYRTNRLMAEIFKKNLQKRVLKGEVNLSNSVCVISNL